jgi:hypothetical protein
MVKKIFFKKTFNNSKKIIKKIYKTIFYIGKKKSVIKIQSIYRGYCVRKNVQLLNSSSLKIQSIYRGYCVRKNVQLLNSSSLKIQSIYHGYKFRKNFKMIKIENSKIILFILTTKYLSDSANYLKILLSKIGIYSKIIFKLNNLCKFYDNLYIFITMKNNDFNISMTPKNYIFWQIEQSCNKLLDNFENNYFLAMMNSIQIYDIGYKNLLYYRDIIPENKVKINQLPYANINNNSFIKKDIDLFFFGNYSKEREKKIKAIKKNLPEYKVIYKWKIFGVDRDNMISRSKFVLNLHYYENAVLEGDRINICVNNNTFVISENVKNESYNISLYKNFVFFIDEINNNLNNVGNCIAQIKNIIKKNIWNTKTKKSFLQNKIKLEKKCLCSFHKNLFSSNHPILNNYSSFSDKSSSESDSLFIPDSLSNSSLK